MTDLSVSVDRASPVPLYFQVAQQIQTAIMSGQLPAGTRLDNEIQLADRLKLSRPTVRQAIQYLVDQGLLVRKRGVGTQVVHSQVRRTIELSSLYDDLAATGQEPSTTVLDLSKVAASEDVAHALKVDVGTTVVKLHRLRSARGEPLALMTNYLPENLVALDSGQLEGNGLYQLLREAGIQLRVAHQAIGARSATAAEAAALGDRRGVTLLTMTRIAYDDEGRAIEYATHAYRASRYSFEMTLVDR